MIITNILRMNNLRINILLFFIIFSLTLKSQSVCDTLPFINCDLNHITGHDENIKNLAQKFNLINSNPEKPIQIIHIGDSHLQAGFLSEKIKQEIFKAFLITDTFASPGFIFPYTVAQTNNPYNYKVDYSGSWNWCKNIDQERTCNLGLSGITLETNDSSSFISIKMNNTKYNKPKSYYFDRIKIFHNHDSSFSLNVNGQKARPINNYSLVQLETLTDSIMIHVNLKDTIKHFELYGIILENSRSDKIQYHTIGVNGATAQSYLKCNYFPSQLKSINPDLIIISLGTNEAFDEDLSIIEHEYLLKDLILQIKDVAPDASIILTTPNDHIKYGMTNKKVLFIRKNILKICAEFELAFWDYYTIMGGEKSIIEWYNKGLTGEDKLHFRKKGYEIQGELFAKALFEIIYNPLLLGGAMGGN